MQSTRVRRLNALETFGPGPIVYWLNREMRLEDNWAFIFARQLAKQEQRTLVLAYSLDVQFLGGGARQIAFKLGCLRELYAQAEAHQIPFFVFSAHEQEADFLSFLQQEKVGALVTDFSPLRPITQWVEKMKAQIEVPFFQVDAHNIVPCWVASPKLEFGAYTLRPKIRAHLPAYLEEFPSLASQPVEHPALMRKAQKQFTWLDTVESQLSVFGKKDPYWEDVLRQFPPGAKAAHKAMRHFLDKRLPIYAEARNDPSQEAQSDLSPYFHYGVLAPQRVALEVRQAKAPMDARDAYLEELIVRRELADNFCFYQPAYDSFEGFPAWAKASLEAHHKDERAYVYALEAWEKAQTHDDLWNAAQSELLKTGKMHGYMRMYWAKKILEWSRSPEEAMKIAITLNDRYELDGRDPNGYAGIAWSIGGLHDRAWFERSVFGKIRYMNANGARTKFDVKAYIQTWT